MSESEASRRQAPRWLPWAILAALMAVALALRWRYIQEVSLFVDEFVTSWAARNVLSRGLPSFPSGNIYPHGFLFTYLVVPFVLGEFNETLVRIPGLIISLLGLLAVYRLGQRLFDRRVGLIAAASMAVDPDCIVWGGRVRMYGLLQLLTILIAYLYYRGLVEDRARDRYLALILVVVAIFTHAEAGLLLPALGLATLVAWPWRKLWRRDVILPFVIAAIGAAAFFLLSKYGQQEHLKIIQESRPYLDLSADLLTGPLAFAPFFTDLHRLPFSLLAVAGLAFLFWPRFDRRSPLTYLYVLLIATLIPLLTLAGATWQNERYLFMLLPLFFLIGGAVLVRGLDLIPALRPTVPWQPVVLALIVALYIGLTGSASAYRQEWGYDLAFRYLRQQREPGDLVLTLSPTPCALYLGHCDRFAIQHGYEEFIVNRPGDGRRADLWTATPVLTETAEFLDLLASGSPVWLVADGWRFQSRYDADFIQAVLDQMEIVHDEGGVMVFRSTGGPPTPPAFERQRWAEFDEALALVGFGLSTIQPQPGDDLEVTLHWQALPEAGVGYTVFLHLLAADGQGVAGLDEPLLNALYQPALWPPGTTMIDRHRLTLPPDLPPGRYRLDIGLYPPGEPDELLPVGGGDHLPLAALPVGDLDLAPPAMPLAADFGTQLRLLGYDLDCQAGAGTCTLTLQWQGLAPMERDYTVFVHLLDGDGTIVAQSDAPPGDPFFPTSIWLPGDRVSDSHRLDLPADVVASEYALLVGVYHQPSGERLAASDDQGEPLGDAVPLVPLSLAGGSP